MWGLFFCQPKIAELETEAAENDKLADGLGGTWAGDLIQNRRFHREFRLVLVVMDTCVRVCATES